MELLDHFFIIQMGYGFIRIDRHQDGTCEGVDLVAGISDAQCVYQRLFGEAMQLQDIRHPILLIS